MSSRGNRGHAERKLVHEESPGSIGRRCRVTPGEGDFKESATEKKTAHLRMCKDEKAR